MPKNDDERKARARYVDQPGQRVDTTPASVKKKQEKAWQQFQKLVKDGKAYKKNPAPKKK